MDKADRVNFSLDDALQAVSQVTVQDEIKESGPSVIGSMLGKRYSRDEENTGRNEIKMRTRCRICKEYGHWWKDRPECAEKMRQKHKDQAAAAAEKAKKEDERKGSLGTDDDQAQEKGRKSFGSFFP